ncbi:hypothetical protein KKF38_05525, partial [Patescibacteria group bacterium]|nr:hypothetical protein [Patescibacteria group bacterium]
MIENLILLAGGIAILFAIIGGYKYMNGSVSDDKEAGKKTIGYALAGCAIALLAWTTVSFAQIWSVSGDDDEMSIFTEEDGGENYEAAPAENNFEKETLENQASDFEKEEGEASENQESNSEEIEALEIEAISKIKDLVKISTDSIEEDESIDIKLSKAAFIKPPEPTFINIGSSASSGFNNNVKFCGLNKNNEGKFGTAICEGSWKVNPCGWTSSCSTGWENAFIGDCVPDCKTEKTCSDLGGDICSPYEICSGSWLDVSDSKNCCDEECEDPPLIYLDTKKSASSKKKNAVSSSSCSTGDCGSNDSGGNGEYVPAEFPTDPSAWTFTSGVGYGVGHADYDAETFSIVYDDATSKWHAMGAEWGDEVAMLLSTSNDGLTNWTAASNNPIFEFSTISGQTIRDNDWYVQTPNYGTYPDGTLAKLDGKWVTVVSNFDGSDTDLHWLTSSDGFTWDGRGDTGVNTGPSGSDDKGEQWPSSLVYNPDNGYWYLYYHGGGDWKEGSGRTVGIAYGSTPKDLTEWSGSFEDNGITQEPMVFKDSIGWIMLYMHGHDEDDGIFYARSDDLLNWTPKGQVIDGDILIRSWTADQTVRGQVTWRLYGKKGSQKGVFEAVSGSGGVTGITCDWSTHIQKASGSDNWPITWADDDNQYTAWGDGWGFRESGDKKSLGVSKVSGSSA